MSNITIPPTYEDDLGNLPWNSKQTVTEYFFKKINPLLQYEMELIESYISLNYLPIDLEEWATNMGKILFHLSSWDANREDFKIDDRPLYWTRIKYINMIKKLCHILNLQPSFPKILRIFEEESRNLNKMDFSSAPPGCKKILITGFDPFLLNSKDFPGHHNIRQSNPSGCVALSLNHTFTPDQKAYIFSMIFPVRYNDFDGSTQNTTGTGEGIVERYLKPLMDKVDMIITISQGKPDQYCLDQFATRTRGGKIDNMGHTRPEGSSCLSVDDPPWISTTLTDVFEKKVVSINDEFIQAKGDSVQHGLPPTPETPIYSGPGGNYLSNEIFYRTARLRELWIDEQAKKTGQRPQKFTGHLHIPKLQDPAKKMPDGSLGEDFNYSETLKLINKVKSIIDSAF